MLYVWDRKRSILQVLRIVGPFSSPACETGENLEVKSWEMSRVSHISPFPGDGRCWGGGWERLYGVDSEGTLGRGCEIRSQDSWAGGTSEMTKVT